MSAVGASGGDDRYTVVVGVSPTSRSPRALAWAVEEAAVRDGRVVAVRAWRPATPTYTGSRPPMHSSDGAAEGEARLADDVASLLGPDHAVECRLVEGGRRKVLLKAARGAQLLVLDAPSALSSAGGVVFAPRLVSSAPCPVVVMPHEPAEGTAPRGGRVRALGEEIVRAAGTAGRPGIRPPLPRDEAP